MICWSARNGPSTRRAEKAPAPARERIPDAGALDAAPLRALGRYYGGLARALACRSAPSDEDDLVFWYLVEAVRLWDRICTIEGETFSAYVRRSGVNLPLALLRRRTVVLTLLFAWPAVAAAFAWRHRGSRRAQWAYALRRPDLYAAFPGMAFSEEIVRERRADMFVAIFNAWHFAATRSPSYAIEDKRVFAARARAAGLPAIEPLALDDARALPGPFMVKDPKQDMGLGVARVEGPEELASIPGIQQLVIQACIENHPALAPLLPPDAPLCTLRLTTTWQRTRPICHLAYFRIGSGGHVDNVSRGGLLVEADLTTGVLGPGFNHAMLHGYEAPHGIARAPGAARDFVGTRLPGFEEAQALCRKAHATLAPDLLSIGWDVALRPEGPVLVEANVFAGSFEVGQFHDSFGRTNREVLRRLAGRA